MKSINLPLTETECQELAAILDIAVKAEGLKLVPLVVKFANRINTLLGQPTFSEEAAMPPAPGSGPTIHRS